MGTTNDPLTQVMLAALIDTNRIWTTPHASTW